MPFSDLLRLALDSLKANKVRSLLTMFGIAVGVFSVVGVMTGITALERTIAAGFNLLGTNSFQISRSNPLQLMGPMRRMLMRPEITQLQTQRFRKLMEDSGATIAVSVTRRGQQVFFEDRSTDNSQMVIGADESFVESTNRTIEHGRGLTAEDIEFARSVCVLGGDLVSRLFTSEEEPLGQRVRVAGQLYTVVGIFSHKGNFMGQSQDSLMVIPLSRYLASSLRSSRFGRSLSMNVQTETREQLPAVMDRAVGAMRLIRGLPPEQSTNDFEVFTNDSLLESFDKIITQVTIGAFIISFIALVVAGVGIMNIMLVSVTERTKEIGVRMSLGAKRHTILRQFLVEAVILAQIGGLVGIAVGVLGGNAFAFFMNIEVVFPIGWVLAAFGFCSVVGIGFGFLPAWRASRLNPIEALRFE